LGKVIEKQLYKTTYNYLFD